MNLIDRIPVPGQFGVSIGTNVTVHLQTTGTVASNTVTIKLNGVNAILNGAFQTGYAGTLISDGFGGWTATINPTTSFTYGSTVTVRVLATEEPGAVAFDQSYSFQTVRDIVVAGTVRYYEEGDVIEADLYCAEQDTLLPTLVDSATFQLKVGASILQEVTFDNPNRFADADGYYQIRLMHPPTIKPGLSWVFTATIDGYEAPGVGTVTVGGTIEWVTKQGSTLATQPDLRVNTVVPRAPMTGHGVTSVPDTAAEYEVVDLAKTHTSQAQPSLLVDLDLTNSQQYVQILTGDPSYTGGGNRLLQAIDDASVWFLQEQDEIPPTFGARTHIEPAVTNLLPNSNLVSNPFSATAPDATLRIDTETLDLTPDSAVKQLHYTIEGSVVYDGTDRIVTLAGPKVTITAGQPVLCSVLCRTELRDATVTLDTFALRVRFFNVADLEVYSVDHNFDVHALETETFNALEAFVGAGSIPGTATKCSFDIRMGSWEGCDLAQVWLAGPAIQHAVLGTSPVVGTTAVTRAQDILTIQGPGNLNTQNGWAELTYVPLFEGFPPAATTLFDTRSAAGLDGYWLQQHANGTFELSVYGPGGFVTTTGPSSPVSMAAGEAVTMKALWGPATLAVFSGQVQLAGISTAFARPTGPQTSIKIGSTYNDLEPSYIELQQVRIGGA